MKVLAIQDGWNILMNETVCQSDGARLYQKSFGAPPPPVAFAEYQTVLPINVETLHICFIFAFRVHHFRGI